jgi:hypothetical protein
MTEQFKVTFIDKGREATKPADPAFPNGVALDLTRGAPVIARHCHVSLPYPAPRCGDWLVVCTRCGLRGLITVAGRRDDPYSVTLLCKAN